MAGLFASPKERLYGAMLIVVGIIGNTWILAAVFSPDGDLRSTSLKITIWLFQILCVLAGSLLILFGSTAIDLVFRHARWGLLVISALLLGLWVPAVQEVYDGWGLFRWLGVDYGIYFAQAEVLRSGNPAGIYSLDALQIEYQQLYDQYPHVLKVTATATHVPYLPLFAWLFIPFTMPEPHVGLILWTLVNVIAGIYLAWRAAAFFETAERPAVALLFLSSYPVVFSLIVGQPSLLLGCAMARFYLALRSRRDLQAGLYLSLLLFKPQYGILIGPLLIWKRRWAAVAGVAIGAVLILFGSIVAVGPATLLEYPRAFTEMAEFRGDVYRHMINWRSLILWLEPNIGDLSGLLLELAAGGLTVLLVVIAWRGEWATRECRFAIQISLALIATLLVNHHSHQHGAVLLSVPLASALAEADLSRFTRTVVVAACLIPAVSFTLLFSLATAQASRLLIVLLATCFASLLAELWVRSRDRKGSGLDTIASAQAL